VKLLAPGGASGHTAMREALVQIPGSALGGGGGEIFALSLGS
jgi:hypothetical protein